jgi:hypothetical protein
MPPWLLSLEQAYGRNQTLFEPRPGGMVSGELATGNGLFLDLPWWSARSSHVQELEMDDKYRLYPIDNGFSINYFFDFVSFLTLTNEVMCRLTYDA